MIRESSYLDEAGINKFFAGMKRMRDREGMSLEEISEQTGISYNDLNYMETGQYNMLSYELTDGLMLKIANVLGYNELEDIINC